MFLDEAAAGVHGVAHEDGEGLVGLDRIVHVHFEQRSRGGVHGGFPELGGIHFAQAFVALDRDALSAEVLDDVEDFFEGEPPDTAGVKVNLDKVVKKMSPYDGADGYEISIRDLPKDVTVIRFVNSW